MSTWVFWLTEGGLPWSGAPTAAEGRCVGWRPWEDEGGSSPDNAEPGLSLRANPEPRRPEQLPAPYGKGAPGQPCRPGSSLHRWRLSQLDAQRSHGNTHLFSTKSSFLRTRVPAEQDGTSREATGKGGVPCQLPPFLSSQWELNPGPPDVQPAQAGPAQSSILMLVFRKKRM